MALCSMHQQAYTQALQRETLDHLYSEHVCPTITLKYCDMCMILPDAKQMSVTVADSMLTKAYAHCREAVKLDSEHSRAWKLLGSALYAQKNLHGAKNALQSALALRPSYEDAFCDLGCVLCALAEVTEAKQAFQNAICLNPHHLKVAVSACSSCQA